MVRAETARLRTAPDRQGKLTALLDAGRLAKVVARKDGWVQLKLATGTTGWVRADLVSVDKKASKDQGAFAPVHPEESHPVKHAKKVEVAAAKPKRKAVVVAKKQAVKHAVAMKPMQVAKAKPEHRPAKPRSFFSKIVASLLPHKAATPPAVAVVAAAAPRIADDERPIAAVSPDTQSTTNSADIAAVPPAEPISIDHPEVVAATAPADTQDAPAPAAETRSASSPAKPWVAAPVNVPINRASKRGDRIVRSALSYRGVPYRFGATGHGAFDCSGFTRYILDQSGDSLPRTAEEQYNHAMPVAKSDLKMGDLVFFKNTYKHGVSHVGIYMGNGRFVHASSHGGVKTSSLNETYFVNHWAGARRPRVILSGD